MIIKTIFKYADYAEVTNYSVESAARHAARHGEALRAAIADNHKWLDYRDTSGDNRSGYDRNGYSSDTLMKALVQHSIIDSYQKLDTAPYRDYSDQFNEAANKGYSDGKVGFVIYEGIKERERIVEIISLLYADVKENVFSPASYNLYVSAITNNKNTVFTVLEKNVDEEKMMSITNMFKRKAYDDTKWNDSNTFKWLSPKDFNTQEKDNRIYRLARYGDENIVEKVQSLYL